jgi:hypothetical protein
VRIFDASLYLYKFVSILNYAVLIYGRDFLSGIDGSKGNMCFVARRRYKYIRCKSSLSHLNETKFSQRGKVDHQNELEMKTRTVKHYSGDELSKICARDLENFVWRCGFEDEHLHNRLGRQIGLRYC